ncbi:MAG: DUF6464 family protein [Cyanobacteriota bacterium]|nr:DUF6464 family protein [Cyanobacteriota bacterium]
MSNNIGMNRMRLQSHKQIKRILEYHEQRHRILSKKIDKQKTCKYNAESAFLRCAVNPSGPCSECNQYESK